MGASGISIFRLEIEVVLGTPWHVLVGKALLFNLVTQNLTSERFFVPKTGFFVEGGGYKRRLGWVALSVFLSVGVGGLRRLRCVRGREGLGLTLVCPIVRSERVGGCVGGLTTGQTRRPCSRVDEKIGRPRSSRHARWHTWCACSFLTHAPTQSGPCAQRLNCVGVLVPRRRRRF